MQKSNDDPINATLQRGILTMPDGQSIDMTKIQSALNFGFQETGEPELMEACDLMKKITGMEQGPSGEFIAVEPPETPSGGYFIMIDHEQTADHCDTLSEARTRGQELCDQEMLQSTWSIYDENSNFIEDIHRSDGKSLEDQVRDFKPLRKS